MKRLIIVRHGNTFRPGQTPTRVGKRTDLPLVEESLARQVGRYLMKEGIPIDRLYAAPLKRTTQTAQLIAEEMGLFLSIEAVPDFLEIDYGPDENKTEDEVIARLGGDVLAQQGNSAPDANEIIATGTQLIMQWNEHTKVPPGWQVEPKMLIHAWRQFARNIPDGETVLVVSSNGVIRFAPHILSEKEYQQFIQHHSLKVKTGSIAIFDYDKHHWIYRMWNKRPEEK